MGHGIVIKVEGNSFEAELNDSMTGKAIYGALPVRAKGQRWGGGIYFSIPVSCELEEDPCFAKASQGRRGRRAYLVKREAYLVLRRRGGDG